MPTIIDELTVKLGFDSSGFKKGRVETSAELKKVRDEANATAKDMQASGKQAADFFSSIKTEVLSLLGVFLGGKGIETFVRDTTRSLADLGRITGVIGESSQDIQAFSNAIYRMGGTVQAAQASLLGLADARRQWELLGNNSPQAAFMGAIGGSIEMSPMQLMRRFSEYAKEQLQLPGGEGRTYQTGAGIGIDQQTILSLIQIAKTSSLGAEMQHSRELGDIATKQQIDAMTRLQTADSELQQAIHGLAQTLATEIAPSLTSLAHSLAFQISNAPKAVSDAAKALEAQRKFDEENQRPVSGPNSWLTNLISAVTGSSGSSWYDYLFGNDMQRDRSLSRAPGVNTAPSPGIGPRANPSDPRGIRNNNPLNLEYLPGQDASASDGRFGIYPSMEAGVSAAANQLKIYRDKYGLNTVRDIVNRWAPPGENNSGAYSRDVARSMGVDPNAQLNLNDPQIMGALIRAMARVENGRDIDPNTVQRGINVGRPTLSGFSKTHPPEGAKLFPGENYRVLTKTELDPSLAPSRLIGPRAAPAANNDNSNTINTGPVIINSPAGDPATHANEFNRAMRDIAAQAESGAH